MEKLLDLSVATDYDLHELDITRIIKDSAINNVESTELTMSILNSGLIEIKNFLNLSFANHLTDLLGNNVSLVKAVQEISDNVLDVLMKLTRNFLQLVYLSVRKPEIWTLMHKTCLKSWDDDEKNGRAAQTVAYGRKMASFIAEIFQQCLFLPLYNDSNNKNKINNKNQ